MLSERKQAAVGSCRFIRRHNAAQWLEYLETGFYNSGGTAEFLSFIRVTFIFLCSTDRCSVVSDRTEPELCVGTKLILISVNWGLIFVMFFRHFGRCNHPPPHWSRHDPFQKWGTKSTVDAKIHFFSSAKAKIRL